MPASNFRRLAAMLADYFATQPRRAPERRRARFAGRPEPLEDRRMMAVEALNLSVIAPAAWQIAEGQLTRSVQSAAGDVRYTLNLEAGQRLAFSARADAVNLSYSLIGPSGNVIVNNVAGAGRTMLLNPYYISASGTYTIALNMPAGGAGNYWLDVAVNTGIEGTGTAAGMAQELNYSYVRLNNGLGRYAWLGQASAASPTDTFSIDLSSKVGAVLDFAVSSRGPDFSGQTLELLDPDGHTILARGTAWSPDGLSAPTGLRIAGFTVTTPGKYTVRLTSNVAGAYTLVVSDAVDIERPSAAQVLNFLVSNNYTTQSSVTALVNTLAFDQVFTSMSTDELLTALLRSGLVTGYGSVSALKGALPSRGVDLTGLRPDGILTALSLADGGSLLTSGGTKLTATAAKSLLQTNFNSNRVAFLDVLSTRNLLQQFDDSILSSATDPVSRFYANTYPPTSSSFDNIISWYITWQRDSLGDKLNVPTPEKAWQALSALPEGQRAIFLADFLEVAGYGNGLFGNVAGYIDSVGADGQPTDYYTIWMDRWVTQAAAKLTAFLTQYKALGGKLDMLVADIEHGMDLHVLQYYEQRIDPNAPMTRSLWQAIVEDPRWPSVKALLIARGLTEADLTATAMAQWSATGREAAIWNAVMEERQADYLNAAIYAPLKAIFPDATLMNFNQYMRTSTIPSGTFYSTHDSPYSVGTILGNSQSVALYGFTGPVITPTGTLQPPVPFDAAIKSISYTQVQGTTGTVTVRLFSPVTALKVGEEVEIENRGSYWINPAYTGKYQITSVAADGLSFTYTLQIQSASYPPANVDLAYRQGSVRSAYVNFWRPYNAFVSDVKFMRTQVAAADAPLAPWVGSRDWLESDRGRDFTYYVEDIFHAVMSGARDLLWWKPSQTTDLANSAVLSAALKELDGLVGFDNRTELVRTDAPYDDGYVLSGLDAGGRRVWRLTPDPSLPVTVLSSSGTVAIQVGGKLVQISNASIYTPTNPSSTLGYWIVQTAGTTQLRGTVDQLLGKIEAATRPTIGVNGYVVRGVASEYTLRVPSTLNAPDQNYSFAIDWDGNGTVDQTVVGPSGTKVMRNYATAGVYQVGVTATPIGASKPIGFSTTQLTVGAFGLQPNEQNPALTDLVFSGTSGRDYLDIVSPTAGTVVVTVRTNGVVTGVSTFTGINGRVIIYGLSVSDLSARSLTQSLSIQFRTLTAAGVPTGVVLTPGGGGGGFTGPVASGPIGPTAAAVPTDSARTLLASGSSGLTSSSSNKVSQSSNTDNLPADTSGSPQLASAAIDAVLADAAFKPQSEDAVVEALDKLLGKQQVV